MLWRLIAPFGAALSGLLLYLSFPKNGHPVFAWFCMAPLIVAVTESRRWGIRWIGSAVFGLLTGLVGYALLFSWIGPVFRASGEHPVFAGVAIFTIALYLALYIAVFALCIPIRWDVVSIVGCAAVWVLLELVRSWVLTGFPWALLGHTQYRVLPLIQVADIGGVYFISYVIIFCNLVIAACASTGIRRAPVGTVVQPLAILICVLALQVCYGLFRLRAAEFGVPNDGARGGSGVKIILLQPNIDQYKKWDERYVAQIRNTFRTMVVDSAVVGTTAAVPGSATLFIWPESAVPGYLFEEPPLLSWLQGLISESAARADGPVYHLVGAVGAAGQGKSWNMAVLFDGEGRALTLYRKVRLVPFGEFVPFRNVLGSVVRVVNQLGEFEAGTETVIFQAGDAIPSFGVLICYESLFPSMTADLIRRGADMLVNITNDGWYLETDCPYQHYSFNVFRAVETRRYLLRAANTGISAVVYPSGRTRETTLMTSGTLEVSVSSHTRSAQTIYVRTERWHWIAYACIGACALWHRRTTVQRGPTTA